MQYHITKHLRPLFVALLAFPYWLMAQPSLPNTISSEGEELTRMLTHAHTEEETVPGFGFAQYLPNLKPKNGTEVGYIPFDPTLDNPDFKLCGGSTPQYYSVSGGYGGGRKQLLAQLEKHPIATQASSRASSGYITVRFVVNCRGQTDRFRVLQIGKDYRQTDFDTQLVKDILSFTKGLADWLPGKYQGATYDYFQYLTFKINDGKVADILP